jgi:CHAT domain-containing protein
LILLCAVGIAGAAAPDFTLCEKQLAAAPERWESARCFYEAAVRGKDWDAAARRLDALSARHPDRPWLLLARAYVEQERRPERLEERYRAAIAAFAARHHTEGEVRARCLWAFRLAAAGRRREAAEQIAVAVRAAEAAGEPGPLAEALVFQAWQQVRSGEDLRLPEQLAQRAEALVFPRGPASQQMLCLELLARLSRDLGRPDRAAGYYRRLEPLARANGRRSLEILSQLGLGILLFDEVDRAPRESGKARAVAQLRRALDTATAAGDVESQANAHLLLAQLLGPPESRGHAERCLGLAHGRSATLTTSCLLALSRSLTATDPAAAERRLEEAHAAAVQSGDPGALARIWYNRMNLSWQIQERGQAIAESRQAIQAVEALRDRQLAEAGKAGVFSRWLAPYYATSGHLLTDYQQSADPAALDLAFEISESRQARVLLDLLAAPGKGRPPQIARRAIEAGLAADEALLAFQIAPRQDLQGFAGGPWLLVSTRRGTRAYPLPAEAERASLETTVSFFLGLIERRDGSEKDLGEALYDRLLRPAVADLPPGVRRLILVPDGILHLLPFAALPLPSQLQISTVPSATLWRRWRGSARHPLRSVLVLADPARTEAALPYARREGRRVLRRFGGAGEVRAGADAGESAFKRTDFSRFGVLHFAAHAVADAARPEDSAVLLAADAPGEDGNLHVAEIAPLHLSGKLVVLSACRTAAGALVGGEGVMSLGRAFFEAGAAAVVGSLWPVRDDEADAFFAVFYDHLTAGESAATALQAAQQDRIRAGAPAQAWAGFVVLGDGDWRLPARPQSRWSFLGWGIAGLLALAAVTMWRRRRRSPRARWS